MWFSAQISNYAKIRFSAQMSNNAKKIHWNTQKTPTKHVLRLFKKFLKIRFSAQKSGSRPRCRTMLEILWNTQKTPTKHALRHFKKFFENPILGWKIRFSAHMSNNAKIPWNTQKPPAKHVLRIFEKFLKVRFSAEKSGSRLRFRTTLKYLETLRKHQLDMSWGFQRNYWKSGSRLKHPVLGSDVEQC